MFLWLTWLVWLVWLVQAIQASHEHDVHQLLRLQHAHFLTDLPLELRVLLLAIASIHAHGHAGGLGADRLPQHLLVPEHLAEQFQVPVTLVQEEHQLEELRLVDFANDVAAIKLAVGDVDGADQIVSVGADARLLEA